MDDVKVQNEILDEIGLYCDEEFRTAVCRHLHLPGGGASELARAVPRALAEAMGAVPILLSNDDIWAVLKAPANIDAILRLAAIVQRRPCVAVVEYEEYCAIMAQVYQ